MVSLVCNDGFDDILLTSLLVSLLLCTYLWCDVVVMATFWVALGGVEEHLLFLFSFELLEAIFAESLVCRANRISSWFLVGRHNASCICGTSYHDFYEIYLIKLLSWIKCILRKLLLYYTCKLISPLFCWMFFSGNNDSPRNNPSPIIHLSFTVKSK